MKYQELRDKIAANLTNQSELIRLVTPENVATVERCAPGILPDAQAPAINYAPELYEVGGNIALALYDDKAAPKTVDEVLTQFTPSNVAPVQFYGRLHPILEANNILDASDYLEELANTQNENNEAVC